MSAAWSDGRPRRPWEDLPRCWSIDVVEYGEPGSGPLWKLSLWIVAAKRSTDAPEGSGSKGSADKRVDKRFDAPIQALNERFKGLAHGGSYGSGAFEERTPWARHRREAGFSLLDFPKGTPPEERERRGALDRLAVEAALRAAAASVLTGAHWFAESKASQVPGAGPGWSDADLRSFGERMLAWDQKAELAQAAKPRARRAARPVKARRRL